MPLAPKQYLRQDLEHFDESKVAKTLTQKDAFMGELKTSLGSQEGNLSAFLSLIP